MPSLKEVREGYGLTVAELAELSGISAGTIYRIESGDSTYNVNHETAEALASALYKETMHIFDRSELSHLGRPPKTGKPCKTHQKGQYVVCTQCNYEVIRQSQCGQCGSQLPEAV